MKNESSTLIEKPKPELSCFDLAMNYFSMAGDKNGPWN
jgi:hypothetical protein